MVVEDVVWKDLINTSVSGDTLTKTGGCDGCLDAGAESEQFTPAGNGYVEFALTNTNLIRYIGLNPNSTVARPTEITFALKIVSGTAEVKEEGQYRADTAVDVGDVLRIEAKSGVVKYSKNGTVFYTSTVTMNLPFQVDTALISMGGSFTNVKMTVAASGGSSGSSALSSNPKILAIAGTENVAWTELVNVTVNGASLQKTSGCDGCQDAGAISQQQIISGDGYLEFTVSETNLVRYIGLNNNSTGTGVTEIPFAIKLVSGYAEVREHDQYRNDINVVTGDVLRIAVESHVVKYYKNSFLFSVSSATASYPLRADTALISSGATITNARIGFTGGSGSILQAPTLTLTPRQTKIFRISWADVSGETEYRLLENADGASGYLRIATIPANSIDHDLEVFLPGRINARYILQACNNTGCADSDPVMVNDTWTQAIGHINAGSVVAVSGDGTTLVTGGRVLIRSGSGNWIQQASLSRSGSFLALSHDGNTLALGSPGEIVKMPTSQVLNPQGQGAVYVYTRNAGAWSEQARLTSPNPQSTDNDAPDNFGRAVALSADGNTLAIGIPGQEFHDTGAVYVFIRSGTNWTQQAHVRSAKGFVFDDFGGSLVLSADGNTLAAGAATQRRAGSGINSDVPQNDVSIASGSAHVFIRSAGAWIEQVYIKASNAQAWAQFGTGIALSNDGDTLAVGAPGSNFGGSDNPTDGGTVYVFRRSSGTWTEQEQMRASHPVRGDQFGWSVALSADGANLAVGMPQTAEQSGTVYVFKSNAGSWQQRALLQSPNAEAGDDFGASVELSGNDDILAVGALPEGGGGAVYLY